MACHSPPLTKVKKQAIILALVPLPGHYSDITQPLQWHYPAITQPRSHPFRNGWYQACLSKATADKALKEAELDN